MKHEMKPKQNPGENPLTCPDTYGCVFILLIAFVNFIAVFYYSVYDQITRDTKTTIIRMKQFRFVLCHAVPCHACMNVYQMYEIGKGTFLKADMI